MRKSEVVLLLENANDNSNQNQEDYDQNHVDTELVGLPILLQDVLQFTRPFLQFLSCLLRFVIH